MRFFCKLAPTLFLAACGPPDPIPYESLAWVNNYYIENPASSLGATAGGWLFRGARDFRGELRVGYLIPKAISGSRQKRRGILSMMCPPKYEKIWEILPPENKLVIIVWTRDNKFKDSLDC